MNERAVKISLRPLALTIVAYKRVFNNLGTVLRLTWVPLLAGTLTDFVFSRSDAFLIVVIALTLGSICFASAAVSIHRWIIDGEDGASRWLYFVVDPLVFHYVWRGILIASVWLLLIVALVCLWLIFQIISSRFESMQQLLTTVFLIAAIYSTIRVLLITAKSSVALPSISVGRPLSWRQSWALAEGNAWRIVFVCVFVFIPVVLAAVPIAMLGKAEIPIKFIYVVVSAAVLETALSFVFLDLLGYTSKGKQGDKEALDEPL